MRSLYREDHLNQPTIARLLSRHKSWVWRRLMLVESLETCVQSDVRLGLIAPRAAVALSRLPRGNQQARSFISGLSGAWSSTRAGGTLQPYAQIYVGPTGDLRMRVSPSDIGMPVDRVGANASCIQVK